MLLVEITLQLGLDELLSGDATWKTWWLIGWLWLPRVPVSSARRTFVKPACRRVESWIG